MSDAPLPPPLLLAAPEPPAPARVGVARPGAVTWAAVIVALVSLACCLLLWQRVAAMQEQLARQSADTGAQAVEARTLARKAEETAQADSARVALLDTRVSELQGYRARLEDLLQNLARARDQNLVADLESAVRLAQDQARLSGNVEPLLAALRTTQQRAQGSADPSLAPVAVAAARDLERVRAAGVPDVAGLLARVDQLLREVDDLPASNSVGKLHAVPPGPPAAPEPGNWWSRLTQAFGQQARDLVRITPIDHPEDIMLAPEQIFFIRENLKLRLMSARMNLLARQYDAARADLSAAAGTLGRYFDPASRRTRASAALLQEVQSYTRAAEAPRVDATLEALARADAAQAPAGKDR